MKIAKVYKTKIALSFLLIVISTSSCKKLVEIDAPITSTTSENIYTNDASAASVLTGLYTRISKGSWKSSDIVGISVKSGLSADELSLYGGSSNSNQNLLRFYKNGLITQTNETFWETFYNYLETVNIALERLSISTSLTPSVRQQLIGEAKFLRAFFYFYLVNLYGDVPLVTTSDYRLNAVLSRSSKMQVYQQIISDLKDAQTLLSDAYIAGDIINETQDRVRPNKWAATALLSRVYLYTGDWAKAETQASAVISNSTLYSLNTLYNAFLQNNSEAIWQLQPVNAGWNTEDARVFILPTSGPNTSFNKYPVYLSIDLINSFEPGDRRKVVWVGSRMVGTNTYYFPYKYKSATSGDPVTEYIMVLRLTEQYLIRSEARAWQNNIIGAQDDLNMIRTRASLSNSTANDKTSLFPAILHERQVELFSEWGHRWLDLKRSNTVDAIMTPICIKKGGSWTSNMQWYPIPLYEIVQDPNIVQNLGY